MKDFRALHVLAVQWLLLGRLQHNEKYQPKRYNNIYNSCMVDHISGHANGLVGNIKGLHGSVCKSVCKRFEIRSLYRSRYHGSYLFFDTEVLFSSVIYSVVTHTF